jgi:hypothetical protein
VHCVNSLQDDELTVTLLLYAEKQLQAAANRVLASALAMVTRCCYTGTVAGCRC